MTEPTTSPASDNAVRAAGQDEAHWLLQSWAALIETWPKDIEEIAANLLIDTRAFLSIKHVQTTSCNLGHISEDQCFHCHATVCTEAEGGQKCPLGCGFFIRVQPSITDAIEEVRDYRKWYDEKMFTPVLTVETQAVHKQFDGMVDRISAQAARHTIDVLVERLSALQAKAGGGERDLCLAKHGGHYCKDQQGHIGKHLTCCTDEYFAAATTPAAVEAPVGTELHWPFAAMHENCAECGRAYEPLPPEPQQSPRVCVNCSHLESLGKYADRAFCQRASTCACDGHCIFPEPENSAVCVECGHDCGVDRGGQCVYQLTVPADSVAVWDDNHCGCHCIFPEPE